MKKIAIYLFAMAALALSPSAGLAMTHEAHDHGDHAAAKSGHEGHDHGNHATEKKGSHEGHDAHGEMGHDSMEMHGDMIMLGDAEVKGVKAMAHLKDVREAMAGMGMGVTHHLMVMLSSVENGTALEKGLVAVRVQSPSGKVGKAVKLMGMQGHFGADITLDESGDYLFTVATKLEDGKKRTFEFRFANP